MGLRTRRRNLRGNDQTQGIGIRLLYRGELLEPTTPKATRKKAEMPRNGRKEPRTRRRPRRRPRSGASPRRKKRERTTKRTAPDTRGSATTARSSWTACRTRRRTASSGSARRTWTTTRRRSLTSFPTTGKSFFVRTQGTSCARRNTLLPRHWPRWQMCVAAVRCSAKKCAYLHTSARIAVEKATPVWIAVCRGGAILTISKVQQVENFLLGSYFNL